MLRIPAPGLMVRDPRTRAIIPAEGVDVPDNDVRFARLIRDGALIAPPDVKAAGAKSPPQSEPQPAKTAEGA